MITAEDVRGCRDRAGVAELFRKLGYPIAPVSLSAAECRRASIRTPWNGTTELFLLARSKRVDLLLLSGDVPSESVRQFMADYANHNRLTTNVLVYQARRSNTIAVFALSDRKSLLRLDVDVASPSRHALDRLNLLSLESADERSAPRIVQRALDRAAVTRQFFLRFRSAVGKVAAAIAASCPEETSDEVNAEALLIMSRLLFLSFIQEKGWLNGERRFLVDRAEACGRHGRDFFADVLVPLFFGCLNTPEADRDAAARSLGRIPYLNGGLFEPSAFERRRPRMHVPNDVLADVLENVFEAFDFTVDEGDSAATKVDPEMLGKVFESLMAEDERAASGSFYSPKEIVDELALGAISEWVASEEPSLRDDIVAVCRGAAPSPSLRTAATQVMARLASMTVLDPACGSGAFLLSALDVIERIGRALSSSPPSRQEIVERSLYGVDLKSEAVRLCELRLWLAIVSTTDAAPENVRPLPNLDRNVLQGNSLLAPLDFLATARGDAYREWSYGLRAQRDLISRYRSARRDERPAIYRLIRTNDQRLATDLLSRCIEADETELHSLMSPRTDLFGALIAVDETRCRVLRDRIDENRRTLERVEDGCLDFFSFDVHFAHVMSSGGFDVVLGNPPWVRHERIERTARQMYRDRYALFGRMEGTRGVHQPDLSVAFLERALSLAAPAGVVSMLVPAKIANASYAARLRAHLASETTIVALHDWTDERRRLFDADTFPLGVTVCRSAPVESHALNVRSSAGRFAVPQRDLSVVTNFSSWTLAPADVAAVLRRIRCSFPPLTNALGRHVLMGVKTGDNRRFFLDGSIVRGRFITREGIEIPLEFVCRCARGRNVRRWSCEASEWMLWPPRGGWRELPPWLQQLAVAHHVEPQALRLSFVKPEHVGIKTAWKDVSRGMAATVLPDTVHIAGHAFPLVPNQTLYSIDCVSLDEAYIVAAMLNSTIAGALLLETAERAKDDHFRYFGTTVAQLPMPMLDGRAECQSLLKLSRQAHRTGRTPEELDRVAAALYGVTAAELSLLRQHVDRILGPR